MWALEPDLVYLNHGSFGACPASVLLKQQEIRDELERQPMRFFTNLGERIDSARVELARFINADPQDVAFVPNATTAVNSVLRSMTLEAGDELLITDHSYNACANAVRFVATRAGARTVVAHIPFPLDEPGTAIDAIMAAVTDKTRLAVIDHITSPTALVLPVAEIATRLSERGIEVLIDGAHGPGSVPLDMRALVEAGMAHYTGNLHKWVCSPKGAGFLYVRRDRQPFVRPVVLSHGANSPRTDRSRFLLEFDWTGTFDPSAVLCVPEALRVVGAMCDGGWPEVMKRNRDLVLDGRRAIASAIGVDVPAPDDMIASMASLILPPADPAAPDPGQQDPMSQHILDNDNVQTMLPVWPMWPSRLVRLSAQQYNDPGDYAKLGAALCDALNH
jgi:isopenicillin-N epimerase